MLCFDPLAQRLKKLPDDLLLYIAPQVDTGLRRWCRSRLGRPAIEAETGLFGKCGLALVAYHAAKVRIIAITLVSGN